MDEVIFEQENGTLIITLNREKVLNALNLNMVRRLYQSILEWKKNDKISGVLIKGSGEKAFCAGGDIVSIFNEKNKIGSTLSHDFFKEEYILNFEISNFGKPWISLLDGITMGGGLGLSVHGSHRLVTEKTRAAMPETAIGLFPDVGGGYFLSRMPGYLGSYLALTGSIIDGANSIYSGIGTHFLKHDNTDFFIKKLLSLKRYSIEDIDEILLSFDFKDAVSPSLENEISIINDNFCFDNIQSIFSSLEKKDSDWGKEKLNILSAKSPTSMGVALQQLSMAKNLTLKDCLSMEFRICQTMMKKTDFYEGVRANLVDKDRKPNWNPKSVSELDKSIIDEHFINLGNKELFN